VNWIHLTHDRVQCFEHGTGLSGSIKGAELLDELSDY
jgi:hypothetical protein